MDPKLLNLVFHAYDVRGKVEDGLTPEFFYNLGKAFVTFLEAKKIVVGYDIRPESKMFAEQVTKGAMELGCDVVNIGEIATEVLYFATGNDKSFDGGMTITASHNPAGWNGAKMVAREAKPLSSDWGLSEIKDILANARYAKPKNGGKASEENVMPKYKNKVLKFIGNTKIKKFKIVVDAGNGIGGKIFDYVFDDLNLEVIKMYFDPDGRFPNHVPDPLKEENVQEIKKRVIEEKADFGIAIDGDADRVFFIDNTGRNPLGVYTGSIFARYFCIKETDAKIIYDPRVIWPLIDIVDKYKGIPIISKSGHAFIKEKMRDEDAIFGCEVSCHFYYKDFYYADSGMVTVALMLKLLSQGLDLTKSLDFYYSTYILSGEVNYIVDNLDMTITKVKEKFSDGLIQEIDGISVAYDGLWRFNLRKSNTENLLRLNIEGKNIDIVKEKFYELESVIGGKRAYKPALKELL